MLAWKTNNQQMLRTRFYCEFNFNSVVSNSWKNCGYSLKRYADFVRVCFSLPPKCPFETIAIWEFHYVNDLGARLSHWIQHFQYFDMLLISLTFVFCKRTMCNPWASDDSIIYRFIIWLQIFIIFCVARHARTQPHI